LSDGEKQHHDDDGVVVDREKKRRSMNMSETTQIKSLSLRSRPMLDERELNELETSHFAFPLLHLSRSSVFQLLYFFYILIAAISFLFSFGLFLCLPRLFSKPEQFSPTLDSIVFLAFFVLLAGAAVGISRFPANVHTRKSRSSSSSTKESREKIPELSVYFD
jgi:hypothetical protein